MSVQDKIDLNDEQQKAWTQLLRAVNKCKKANIYFYQVLEHLNGLNGDNVATVVDGDSINSEEEECLQYLSYPSISIVCGFADDTHFVELK